MEQETIRDIEAKSAQIKRAGLEPQTVKRAGAVVGVLLGITCAVYLYFTEARGSDSFFLTLACAAAGGVLGYHAARGVLFLREAIHGLYVWATEPRTCCTVSKDKTDG